MVPGDEAIMERPRIKALLDIAAENYVVLVTAGEGYGKTCALRSFLEYRNETVIRIPLTEKDNDPSHFWETVINSILLRDPRAGSTIKETGFPKTKRALAGFFAALDKTDAGNKKYIVALDDFHLIKEKAITDFINRLLAFPPLPRKTFLFISRSEPKINTMSLLSKGRLARINADDLRFNEEEILHYFRSINICLSDKDASAIFADTEGWAQALNLVAGEMKARKIKYSRRLWKMVSFRIMEESLFGSVSVPLQRFLVVLSLFNHWPGEALERIAGALSGNISPAKELYGNINKLSSLISYDSYLQGFKIHKTFLSFLREKQKDLNEGEIKTACLIAGQWCEENKIFIEAAENYGRAAEYGKMLGAIYSFTGLISPASAAVLLEVIDRVLSAKNRREKDESFLFIRHVTRAGMLISLGCYIEAESSLKKTIAEFESLPPGRFASRVLSACYNSLAVLSFIGYRKTGDISAAPDYFRRGNYYYMLNPYPVYGPAAKVSIGSYVNPVGHTPAQGEFEALIETIALCVPHASNSMAGYLSGVDSLCRAELAFFRGDLNLAEENARKAVSFSREKEQYEVESKSLFYLYRIHLCNGNIKAFRETWKQMEAQLDTGNYNNRYIIHDIMTGWFNAHIGETERIAPWLRNEFEESDLNPLFLNFETMVKAKSLYAQKKYNEALEFLARNEAGEGLGSFHLGALEISVLKAVIQYRMADEKAAIENLETAYMMSVSNSFEMPFVELGEDMRLLTGIALNAVRCNVPRPWLEIIRNKSSVYAKKLSGFAEYYNGINGKDEIPFLGSQETIILRGISQGLTREEIAANSSIPVNLVKNTIKIIYNKLGAFNRADAIRIAAKAGILEK